MKKIVCALLSVLLLTSSVFAVTVTESVPCIYENIVLFREGDLLQTVKGDRGVVCRLDGSTVLDSGQTQHLMDGYILVGDYDGQTLWSSDGVKITGKWDEISEVSSGVAICGKGIWEKPGRLHGVYGALDLKTGNWIVPQEYSQIYFSQDRSYLIALSVDGRHAFDLTGGEIPVPVSESGAFVYENGMYSSGRNGSVFLHYADGGISNPGNPYARIEAVCGNAVFAKKANDETLYCFSLTGQLLGSYPKGYVAFHDENCDFVLIGRNQKIEEIAVVNRWGETLSPYTKGDSILSGGGRPGKGLELYNALTGKTRWLMADGREVPYVENGILLPNLGAILVGGETPSLMDLDGKPIVPAGTYRSIEADNSYYSIGVRGVRPDGLVVQNTEGKYGLLRIEGGYDYPAHTWAQKELDEAISAGIIPDAQQRDWREDCTRGDFCRLVSAVLDATGKTLSETVNIAFADTADSAILHAARLGIVNGVGGGRFAPERPVTRQEAAVMLARAAELLGLRAEGAEKQFSDRDEFADWAKTGIGTITRITGGGTPVMQGISADRFAAKGAYTREQAILTMLRLYRTAKG